MPGTFTYTVATKIVVVTGGTSGAPATFADFVLADRAGTGTVLKAASAPSATFTLTYPVRPVELRAIPVKFIVASKTAEADYLFITGTDAWDAAQTESIDVSAGNGSYTSTKRWRTITNIDCSDNPAGGGTVWADGTLSVTQDIWGVIWDKGNGQYQLDAKLQVGDSSNSTYFKDTNKQIVHNHQDNPFSVKNNATLHLGDVKDAAKKSVYNGCSLYSLSSVNFIQFFVLETGPSTALQLYGCNVKGTNGNTNCNVGNCTVILWHNTFDFCYLVSQSLSASLSVDIYCNTWVGLAGRGCGLPSENTRCFGQSYGGYFDQKGRLVKKALFIDCANTLRLFNYNSENAFLVDCNSDNWTMSWSSGTSYIYRQFTFNLELQDKDGVAQAGKVVKMVNANGDTVFEETTDANGNITFSGQHSSPESNAVSYKRYYYSGSAQTQDYSPFKLYIDGAHVATYGSDDVESWEANGGANLVGPIGGGGGIKMIREVLHAIA